MSAQIKNIAAARKKKPAQRNEFGDVLNGRRFAKKFAGRLAYTHQTGKWLEFVDHAWVADELGRVMQHAIDLTHDFFLDVAQMSIEAARGGGRAAADEADEMLRHAKASQNKPRLEAMLSIAKTEPEIAMNTGSFDANDQRLGVKNGVIELDGGIFRDGEPEDYISRQAGSDFDGDADCPTFLRFLSEVQPDPDVRSWLQRFCGYCLTGSTAEQIFLVSHGNGANGKSVFWEVIRKMLNEYATTVQFDTFTEKNNNDSIRNDLARLDKVRLVIANEGQNGARLDEGIVKQITGGDEITARFLHREFFTFRPRFKVSLITNHKPVISGNDNGIWRRVVLLPWQVTIPAEQRDRNLEAKLTAELPGVLNWALEGLQRYKEVGLDLPAALVRANAEYRQDSDVIGLWLADCAALNSNSKTPLRQVYNSYKQWATDNGHKPMSSKSLGDRLKERGIRECRIGSAGTRGWEGVSINFADCP